LKNLAGNLQSVYLRMEQAALRANRDPSEISLICVTKQRTLEQINHLLDLGVTDIGENRVQEAKEKIDELKRPCRKHLIGSLQRNKVSKALELFDLIHSVDRISLIQEISRKASGEVPILLQVNVSGETSKSGIAPNEVQEVIKQALDYPNIRIKGFMTMAPFYEDPELTRPVFKGLYLLASEIKDKGYQGVDMDILSMGMSNDFEVAIEEGATHIRVGTAIFT
jgi:pyridoxal phosphate enzyme (YggS family)